MDHFFTLVPVIKNILKKKPNSSINVTKLDDILTVNILIGRRKKVFANKDTDFVLHQLERFLVKL